VPRLGKRCIKLCVQTHCNYPLPHHHGSAISPYFRYVYIPLKERFSSITSIRSGRSWSTANRNWLASYSGERILRRVQG
jgi:hypothetical protein